MRALTVLLTASGVPGSAALIRALRENGERELRLVGTDMSELAIGRHLCDSFHVVPAGGDPGFVGALVEICDRERVDAVLPQSSYELQALAENRERFGETTVLVASPEAVRRSNDKAESYALLDAIGVRGPAWRRVAGAAEVAAAARELGYPAEDVAFKPLVSSGSRGFRILSAAADRRRQLLENRPGVAEALRLEELVELLGDDKTEALVMELARGPERTIDGIARGHFFNIQLVGEAVIEINPRISTVVFQEDLNLPYLGVKHALGELDDDELAAYASRVRPTRRALRYFDQVEWDS
ncbi:MAG: hypothetical protein AUG88_00105 [Actinobacteria bacterium 13_1_20CM_4_68_12]|nr:MAG: hypothetical protein AUG88_00105 [Actinobacteria bacterium 13_1_20CM_4_68_12]